MVGTALFTYAGDLARGGLEDSSVHLLQHGLSELLLCGGRDAHGSAPRYRVELRGNAARVCVAVRRARERAADRTEESPIGAK